MSVQIDQIIRSPRKSLSLTVEPDGSLIVRAPLKLSERMIRDFVESKKRWIGRRRLEAEATKPPAPREFVTGETFLYLGHSYPLEIVANQKRALLLDGHFRLSQPAQSRGEIAFQDWYRRQARKILTERVSFFAERNGLHFEGIRISSARTRWGSCSSKGVLSFTWRLILTPMNVIEYVVVHELVHTRVHNHSKRFWNKVEQILPNYRAQYEWLRKNGHQVNL
jgi:predicted metal-dependent hydrolase